MKTYLDCVPCFFSQALTASRLAGADDSIQRKILLDVANELPGFSLSLSPPEMGRIIHGLVKKHTQIQDPYMEIKKRSNAHALSLYPDLCERVSSSDDQLLGAVEIAILGNIIDYGMQSTKDVSEKLNDLLNKEHYTISRQASAHFNYHAFKKALDEAENILYIGDNAGEVVFDRILIETIKKSNPEKLFTYAVREEAIINDALIDDAIECGIDRTAEIVSSGSDSPGAILSRCSDNFLDLYRTADLIISKGQGNFEALSEEAGPVFFLLLAKCPVIARNIGCTQGDILLMQNST